MSEDLKLKLVLKAFDGMSNVVKSACRQSDDAFEKMNKSLESTAGKFDEAGKKAAVFGGALVGLSAVNLKTAGDFEQGMNNVSTLIDTNTENLGEMSKEVLKLAKNSPKAINDLTEGLYSIRSAGISAEEQFNVLHGSEMLSVAGLSTTAEAVDIATSAINAFNIKGEEQAKMYDTLFKVVKYGKTNISEFAQGFGSVAGVVASAGIKLDEYSAAVAAMTTTGLKANNAHTQMSAAIASLTRSSKEQTVIFKKLGANSFKDLVAKSGGMVNAFKKIEAAVKGDEAKMVALMGSINGYKAVMGLTNTVNEKYVETLSSMRNGSDALSEAYDKQDNGLNNQMAMMKNNLQALSIEFGTALLPLIKAAGGLFKNLTDKLSSMPDGLKSFLAVATAGIGGVSLFGGTALMAVGGIIKNIIFLRKVMRTFSIVSWANPAILPIIGVTAVIAGLAAGAVYCYNKFEGFRNVCQGLWAVVKAGGAWLAVLWQSFITGAGEVWNFIKPAVKFGIEILKWTTPIGLVIEGIQKLCGALGQLIQKAGGLRGFGNKLKNWAGNQETKAAAVNEEIKRNRKNNAVDGSHANGLDFVPFDGYRAELHYGERIQTRKEADLFRSGEINTINNKNNPVEIRVEYNPTINFSSSNISEKEKDDFIHLLNRNKDEIVRLISSAFSRQEARSYV